MTVVLLIFENYTLTLIVTTHSLPGHLQIVSRLPGKTDKGTPGGLNARSQRDCLFIPPFRIPRDQWLPFPLSLKFHPFLLLPQEALFLSGFGTRSAADC